MPRLYLHCQDTPESHEATALVTKWLYHGTSPSDVLQALAALFVGTSMAFDVPLQTMQELVAAVHEQFANQPPVGVVMAPTPPESQ